MRPYFGVLPRVLSARNSAFSAPRICTVDDCGPAHSCGRRPGSCVVVTAILTDDVYVRKIIWSVRAFAAVRGCMHRTTNDRTVVLFSSPTDSKYHAFSVLLTAFPQCNAEMTAWTTQAGAFSMSLANSFASGKELMGQPRHEGEVRCLREGRGGEVTHRVLGKVGEGAGVGDEAGAHHLPDQRAQIGRHAVHALQQIGVHPAPPGQVVSHCAKCTPTCST